MLRTNYRIRGNFVKLTDQYHFFTALIHSSIRFSLMPNLADRSRNFLPPIVGKGQADLTWRELRARALITHRFAHPLTTQAFGAGPGRI